MKHSRWQILLGLSLIVLSVLFYLVHYIFFHDLHHILIYLVGDIAFVPIEVLLVTLVIHQLLSTREKRAIMEKLNMVIGVFFSEVGTELLKRFSDADPHSESIREKLIITGDWSDQNFLSVSKLLKSHNYEIEGEKCDLENLRSFLMEKRDFLLRLLENPNLLEHESFANLLWAITHLSQELSHRPSDLKQLVDSDCAHVNGDIRRAYAALVSEWLKYMKHLKNNYPYLFSLAMRTNPFDPDASPEVK